MNITDLIVEFIQQGNVVEIPGVGTLTGSNVSAYHDAATSTYYPPRRTVALTPQQNGNKAIVRCIAERECVNVDTAEQIWNNFVSALDDKLKRVPEGHEFPGIGTLRRDNGQCVFEALPGLDLDAGKKHAQPLENVSTYTPKESADPFAIFDRPAATSKEQAPATTPQPVEEPQPEEKPTPAAEESAAEAPAAPEQPVTAQSSEPVKVVEPVDPKATEKAEKAAAKAAVEAEKAAAKAAADAAKAAEKNRKAEAKKAMEEAKQNAKAEKKRHKEAQRQARLAIREEKRMSRAEKKKEKEQRPRRRLSWGAIIITILLALIALLGLGYYVYSRYYVPETRGVSNAEHVTLPPYSMFSRSLDGIHYEDYMVRENVAGVKSFMGDYIRQYLQARHYVNAYAVVMDRIGEYADLRLRDMLSDDHCSITRILHVDEYDYYRRFCYRNLQDLGGYMGRCRVQGELMDEARLDEFLDDLINELGLHPDGVTRTVDATPKQAKTEKEYVEVVPPAPTFKASKQGFDIIAGFCTQKSKADKMANHLKDLGCDAYVINRSGLYYVSMGSASTRTGAEALYNHIKSWYQGDITIKNFNE